SAIPALCRTSRGEWLTAAAPKALETRPSFVVEPVSNLHATRLLVARCRRQGTQERPRAHLPHLLPRGVPYEHVRRDEAHLLGGAQLRGKALEERVGVARVAHLERAESLVRPLTVEHEHAARAA